MPDPRAARPDRPWSIAHRGGNSLAGLEAALDLDVDVVECDVHWFRGRLEVRHLKTAGPLPFLWDHRELVSASAPRLGLADLMAADRAGTTFMLDLKGPHPRTARAVATLLHDVGHSHPLLACGRWWAQVDRLAAAVDFVRPVLSARRRAELGRLRRRLRRGPAPWGVSVHRSLVDEATVRGLHDLVGHVMTWPVDDVDTMHDLLEAGVDGIISERREVLAAVAARRDGRPGR